MEGAQFEIAETADIDYVEVAHAQQTESEHSSVFTYPRFSKVLV
jgi:hypothetical protein